VIPNLRSLRFQPKLYRPDSRGFWSGHLPFAVDLIDAVRPSVLVELGTHHGESYFGFCQAIHEGSIDCRTFAVDTWQGDRNTGRYGPVVFEKVSAYNSAHYARFSSLLRMTFDQASSLFADGTVDFLHLDGCHTYRAAKADFETWLPKMSSGGIILLHDIAVRGEDFEVWRFWDEVSREFPSFAFFHSSGLGVLANGELNCSENSLLNALFRSTCAPEIIRDYYFVCAEKLSYESRATPDGAWKFQVYSPDGTGYFESRSEIADVRSNQWISLAVEVPSPSGRMRVDPLDHPGFVEILELTVLGVSDENILWRWDSQRAGEITCAGSACHVPDDQALMIFSYGDDPQLYLPSFPVPENSESVRVQCRLRAEPGFQALERTFRKYSSVLSARSNLQRSLVDGDRQRIEQSAKLQVLEEQNTEIRTALTDANTRYEEAERQRIEQSAKLQVLEEQNIEIRTALTDANTRYEEAERQGIEQSAKLQVLKTQNGEIRAALAEAASQRKIVEGNLQRQSGAWSAERQAIRLENSSLEQEIKSLRNSLSWRLTAPVRKMADIVIVAHRVLLRIAYESRAFTWIGKSIGKAVYAWRLPGASLLLPANPFFSPEFYARNSDVSRDSNLWAHYLGFGADEGRNPSPHFDTQFYLSTNPDVVRSHLNPLIHYHAFGAKENRRPNPSTAIGRDDSSAHATEDHKNKSQAGLVSSGTALQGDSFFEGQYSDFTATSKGVKQKRGRDPLFDTPYFLKRCVPALQAGTTPLAVFLTTDLSRPSSPHPLFDVDFYLSQGAVPPGVHPLVHYLVQGAAEHRDPHPLFESRIYGLHDGNPLVHYILEGGIAGRRPCMLFDGHFYLQSHPEVAAAGINPLMHYLSDGFRQGWWPNPLFDPQYYVKMYPEVASLGIPPLLHYAIVGATEGKQPNPLFSSAFYMKLYPDVATAGLNPLGHYLVAGGLEGRCTHPWFDGAFYLKSNPEVKAAGMNPLLHFLSIGGNEGRDPSSWFDSKLYWEQHPESAAAIPLIHYLENGGKPSPDGTMVALPAIIPAVPGPRLKPPRDAFNYSPLISILLPVYNTPPEYLRLAIESVMAQSYPNWELCICDDGSSRADTIALLSRYAADPRIRIECNASNSGISRATNAALAIAKGEYVAMLDHDDELEPDALLEVVCALNDDPARDVLYTDQDYVHPDGRLSRWFYKPDWSLEFFRGVMYVGHLLIVRRSLALDVQFNPQFDNVQDFEFMLRVAERTDRIHHIPKILYHWRMVDGSVASNGSAKPNIEALQAAAVNGHFHRCGIDAEAISNPSQAHRIIIKPRKDFDTSGVTVVALDGGSLKLNASRFTESGYKGLAFSSTIQDIETEFALVVENGLAPASEDWIEQLLFYAGRDGIGLVVPLIVDDCGLVDTAGLILREEGVFRAMRGEPPTSDGYAGSLSCSREVSTVSGECFMIRNSTLKMIGGVPDLFTSPLFRGADLGLRARRAGLRNICNVHAIVRRTQGVADIGWQSFDQLLFKDIWANVIADGDPFHNPNFAPTGNGFVEKDAPLRSVAQGIA
jgi:GT2 family glycosyltransferase